MKTISGKLETDIARLKELLPAEDILTFSFVSEEKLPFTVIFADPITDKELLGEQVVRPLLHYAGKPKAEDIGKQLTSPELRSEKTYDKLCTEILAGNPVLLWEGADEGIIVGTKKVFVRAISEPPPT